MGEPTITRTQNAMGTTQPLHPHTSSRRWSLYHPELGAGLEAEEAQLEATLWDARSHRIGPECISGQQSAGTDFSLCLSGKQPEEAARTSDRLYT